MNTITLRLCFALTIIFSAASGFSYVLVPAGYQATEKLEDFETCSHKINSTNYSAFLNSFLRYLDFDQSNTKKVQKVKDYICENSYSLDDYVKCHISAKTNIEKRFSDSDPEYKLKKMAFQLCEGVLSASATVRCVETVKKFNIGMVREIVLCRGNVPFTQNGTAPAEFCFLDEYRKVEFIDLSIKEVSSELDRIVTKCTIRKVK